MADDEEAFISGIFNYCDRWCERCPQTARCRVFAMDREDVEEHPELRDPANAAFWDSLGQVFAKTIQMIRDDAQRLGIDLDAADPEVDQILRSKKRLHRRARRHGLVQAARRYGDGAGDWFDRHEDLFRVKQDEWTQRLRLGLEGPDPQGEAIRLADAVEVIRWYQHQIEVKLIRALGDVLERDEEQDEDMAEVHRHSAVGSAKVALIGIERSLAAWSLICAAMPDEERAVLDLLVQLDRLRRDVDAAFPAARAFLRPGLDEPA